MKVFKDIFTEDELFCDSFKYETAYDDVILKSKSQYKKKDQVGQVDIGCGNAFGGQEEEDGQDGGEPGEEKVIDIVFNGNLTETQFSKSDFMTYIKGYLKNLKEKLQEDRVAAFQKGAQDFIKFVVSKFNDFTFYTGSSESLDGSIAYSFWEDESASGPVFYFFKDGLKEQKL